MAYSIVCFQFFTNWFFFLERVVCVLKQFGPFLNGPKTSASFPFHQIFRNITYCIPVGKKICNGFTFD